MLYGFPTTAPELLIILVDTLLAAIALLIASKILFSRTSMFDALKFGFVVNLAYYIINFWLSQVRLLLVTVDLFLITFTTFTVIDLFVWYAMSKLIKEIDTTDAIIGFVIFWIFTENTILNLHAIILTYLMPLVSV